MIAPGRARQLAHALLADLFNMNLAGELRDLEIAEADADDEAKLEALAQGERDQVVAELLDLVKGLERGAGVEPARRCKRCGCTDNFGCAGGCTWVTEDLCSACSGIVLPFGAGRIVLADDPNREDGHFVERTPTAVAPEITRPIHTGRK